MSSWPRLDDLAGAMHEGEALLQMRDQPAQLAEQAHRK